MLYDGVGTLFGCGLRLCPSCSASLRRRARARARAALARCAPRRGELWRFVTLTAPTLPGVPVLGVRRIFDRAWSLFRKREFWSSRVRACVKGEEFTVTQTGYHYHIHILALGKWIEFALLRSEWTACLRAAWHERGLDVEIQTATGEAVVDVRLVRDRRHSKQARGVVISLESALQETTKYITKSESWDVLPDAHLVEVAEVERWPRMFEVLGDCRPPRESADDLRRRELRERDPARMAEWIASDPREGRAALVKPDDWREAPAFLDTQGISDGAVVRAGPVLRVARSLRERAPSLRALSVTMERSAWLQILSLRVSAVCAYRKAMLMRRYPYAIFNSLAGNVWSG